MPQISHSRSRGLLRKVHATQATSPVGLFGAGTGGEGAGEGVILSFERFNDDEGSEVESEDVVDAAFEGMFIGALIDARGTPHNVHTADEVSPTKFLLLHTSHSQNSTSLEGAEREGVELVLSCNVDC